VRSFARTVLQRHGYHVLEAASSEAALARLGETDGAVDLLLTDVMLSGMDGGQLARCLRRGRPELRVLFMSGYADPGVVLLPNADVLAKPFTAQALLSRVRESLSG
jgi:CheY-like chemotaxis protein